MMVKIFVSGGDTFEHLVPDGTDQECYALPKDADRFDFWRRATGNRDIKGHAMVWSVLDDGKIQRHP